LHGHHGQSPRRPCGNANCRRRGSINSLPIPAPDASGMGAASRGPFYFAWGCFRNFVRIRL
jgi:hypothetical protein